MASAPREYLPKDPINISFTAASTAFQLVNGSSGPKKYSFSTTQPMYLRRGFADVSAATTTDVRLLSTVVYFFWLLPGEGVRAIRVSTDGVLQIGSLEA